VRIHPQPADATGPAAEPPASVPPDAVSIDRSPVGVDVTTSALRGLTLVRVELRSDIDEALRVRVSNRLDGPVLPPRDEGVPADGWDAAGFTGRLPAAGGLGIGYACPVTGAPAADAAVSVDLLGSAPESPETTGGAGVADAIRDLGRAAPPVDAVPTPDAASPSVLGANGPLSKRTDETPPPQPVSAWLAAVESRIERAERLTDATASEAAVVLESDANEVLPEVSGTLAADLAALRTTADRIQRLADRAAAADPGPVADALRTAAAALDTESRPETERRSG
jgi:hypothetical protein